MGGRASLLGSPKFYTVSTSKTRYIDIKRKRHSCIRQRVYIEKKNENYPWVCAHGHYLHETPSLGLDTTVHVQKGACVLCVTELKETALGHIRWILNAIFHRPVQKPSSARVCSFIYHHTNGGDDAIFCFSATKTCFTDVLIITWREVFLYGSMVQPDFI